MSRQTQIAALMSGKGSEGHGVCAAAGDDERCNSKTKEGLLISTSTAHWAAWYFKSLHRLKLAKLRMTRLSNLPFRMFTNSGGGGIFLDDKDD